MGGRGRQGKAERGRGSRLGARLDGRRRRLVGGAPLLGGQAVREAHEGVGKPRWRRDPAEIGRDPAEIEEGLRVVQRADGRSADPIGCAAERRARGCRAHLRVHLGGHAREKRDRRLIGRLPQLADRVGARRSALRRRRWRRRCRLRHPQPFDGVARGTWHGGAGPKPEPVDHVLGEQHCELLEPLLRRLLRMGLRLEARVLKRPAG